MEFRETVMGYGQAGDGADGRRDTIEHSYWAVNEAGEKEKQTVEISFWDLHFGIKDLAPRKREALFYNVILDLKQEDVAKKWGSLPSLLGSM